MKPFTSKVIGVSIGFSALALMVALFVVGLMDFTGNEDFLLRGKVVDDGGQPVSGVAVSAIVLVDTHNSPVKVPWGGSIASEPVKAVTDASGQFEIGGRGYGLTVGLQKHGFEGLDRHYKLHKDVEIKAPITFVLRTKD
ncbi:Ig-like domain-containing protein [Humisphaera borealis]|uniref:Carboxypeptidase regulatory-like domain-containing protein n=1 Tax=Humisphaera borealis TaxID=2807512 RepID=A0A7M2WZM0_9BACT|nr:hypothetical protein [Humisphaera borealis]QOV90843.1 hypothetical protein IPV69_05650 [Humisphaera borealis]